jgi:hypothetical protein
MSKSITYQTGWVLCVGCNSLVFTDGEATGGVCIVNSYVGHIYLAPDKKYRVAFEGKGIKGQTGWRHCCKCSALFFVRNETKGVCPKDHGTHDDSESGPYELHHTTVNSLLHRWRWCRKCEQLFLPTSNNITFCPRGGMHDSDGSGFYFVKEE